MALRTACGIAVCVCALTAALTAAGCGQAASSATPAVSGAPEQGPEAPDVAASTAPATTAVTTQESDSAVGPVTITIVYDNTSTGPELSADWGFACVIETGGPTILFDTGASGSILLGNLRALGIPPADIDAVVISHAHSDHVGGLKDFLRENSAVTLFVPASFPEGTRNSIAEGGTVVEVITSGREYLPGVSTTGELPGPPAEQALVLETAGGVVMVTGCAHPGVATMVGAARALLSRDVDLVVGGFHMGGMSAGQVDEVARDLRALGVRRVCPAHCTGEVAVQALAASFGSGFIPAGVGTVIRFP